MQIHMKSLKKHWQCHQDKIMGVLLIGLMLFMSTTVFADDGKDIIGGLDKDLLTTLKGSGRYYLYLIEGVIGLGAYMKTKNLLFLSGILVVACFFNIVIKVAGA